MSFKSYHKSMERVFIVEKSMAMGFYPYKLSQAFIEDRPINEIEEMLNVNHKVFNTVITDCQNYSELCPEQKIIIAQYAIDDISELNNAAWVPLRDSAPFDNEKVVSGYKENGIVSTISHSNTGSIIGRVYFLESKSFTSRTLGSSLKYWIHTIPAKVKDGRENNDVYSFNKNLLFSLVFFVCFSSLGILVNAIRMKRDKERDKYQGSITGMKQSYRILSEEKDEAINENAKLTIIRDKLTKDLEDLEREKTRLQLERRTIESESLLLKQEQDQLIIENQELEQKYSFILNYAMANKFQLENEFTAPIKNQIQKLNLIIEGLAKRSHFDTKDALHDLRKAPLLRLTEDSLVNEGLLAEVQLKLIQSKQTIEWTAQNIERLTDLNMSNCDVYEVVKEFLANRPPSARRDFINVTVIKTSDEALITSANPYHIQAIIKNVLYNSFSELEDIRLWKYRKNPQDFVGKVDIICGKYNEEYVFIRIRDNAGGVPEAYIEKLYESSEKVNLDSQSLEGNGSLIVASYISMYGAKVIKSNIEDGFEVTFLFKNSHEG